MLTPIFLLLLASPAFAASTAPVVCPASKTFYGKIYNCGMNKLAPEYGRSCADRVLAESRENGEKLHALMEKMKGQLGNAQSASMGDAKSRLSMAVKDLTRQIRSMQANTNTVASYAEAMIDYPDSDSDDTSPDCFNENFHALQKIVDQLDTEIVNSKKARKEALHLLGLVGQSASDMTNLGGGRRITSQKKPKNAKAAPRVRSWHSSDISGTEKDVPSK
jgi:hypothetical protein